MEAYYHNEPRIEEWVEQIIEKTFTTCLLSGADLEEELQKGCELVGKITSLLQELSMVPPEYLEDGLKQILEHQLPDSRVINNFPAFHDNMSKMLNQGMLKVFNTPFNQKDVVIKEIKSQELSKSVSNKAGESLDCIATIEKPTQSKTIAETESSIDNYDSKIESVDTKHVPDIAVRLNEVLKYNFPNVTVYWNVSLMGQKFLARVDDILIYLHDPKHSLQTEKFKEDGWKLLTLQQEDLSYPRRLEREIKNLSRLGRKSIDK